MRGQPTESPATHAGALDTALAAGLAPGVDPGLDPATSPEPVAMLRVNLAAVRRRLFIVRLVRHAYTWAAVSTALAALATVAWTPGTGTAWLWLCAGLAGALAAAAGSAWWRRPGHAAAARAIDRRHNLRGLVDAAREAAGGDDAVSGLIVRDAARALATIAIPDTVPFDVPRPRVVAPLLAAGVAWLLAVSLTPSPSVAPDAAASGGAPGAGGGLRAVAGDPGAGPEAAEAAESIEARGEGDPSATPDADAARGEGLDRDRAPAREDAGGDDGDSRAASPSPALPDAAEGPGAVPPSPADPRADASTNDVSQRASSGLPGGPRQNPDTSPLARQGQPAGREAGIGGRSGAAGRAADGAGATAPDGTTGAEDAQTPRASGGVDGGARLGDATFGPGPRTGAAPPADGAFGVRARAARARALGAGGLERIPPDRRALVRNYFRDIGGEAPE